MNPVRKQFEKFVAGGFGLEIWSGKRVVFQSKKEGIKGLAEFIRKHGQRFQNLTVFDKKVGNAVALLCAYLKVKEVYGVVGSELAGKTFKKFKIRFLFLKTIPNILNKTETDICPIEKLSFLKTPEEFRDLVKIK